MYFANWFLWHVDYCSTDRHRHPITWPLTHSWLLLSHHKAQNKHMSLEEICKEKIATCSWSFLLLVIERPWRLFLVVGDESDSGLDTQTDRRISGPSRKAPTYSNGRPSLLPLVWHRKKWVEKMLRAQVNYVLLSQSIRLCPISLYFLSQRGKEGANERIRDIWHTAFFLFAKATLSWLVASYIRLQIKVK